MYDDLYIWFNPNKNEYYYKINSNTYHQWKVGDKNSYNHELIMIIENEVLKPTIHKHYYSIFYWLLTFLIFLFKNLIKFLTYIKKFYL